MLDPHVMQLLDSGVNTSCKLAIVLQFANRPAQLANSYELAERVCRPVWIVDEAVQQLVADGVLRYNGVNRAVSLSAEQHLAVARLRATHLDPIARLELLHELSQIEELARYMLDTPVRFQRSRVA